MSPQRDDLQEMQDRSLTYQVDDLSIFSDLRD